MYQLESYELSVRRRGNMIPAFVTHKGFEKEEFLNRLGLEQHIELNLYNLLCSYAVRTGKSDVHVNEFVSIVNFWAKERDDPDFAGKKAFDALAALLEKLEISGFAIVEREGKRPTVFHLIDQEMTKGLEEDVVEEINKAYVEIEYNLQNPFPSKRHYEVPINLIKEINYRDFTTDTVSTSAQWGGVICITFSDAVDIVCLPDKLDQLLKLCYKKIHHNLVNNSELFDLVYNGIRNVVGSKEGLTRKQFFEYLEGGSEANPRFWIYLSLVITKSKEKASQVQRTAAVNVGFYQSAYLLYHYWKHEIEVGRKEKGRESDEKQVLAELGSKAKFYNLEELGKLKDTNGRPLAGKYKNFERFLRSFLEASADSSASLPEIVESDGSFIHRKAILPLLFDSRKRASSYLSDYFAECWREDFKLRYSSDLSVVSDEEFKKTVAQRVKREFPSLFRLLNAPELVCASLLENAESNKALVKYEQLLFESTDSDDIRYREWNKILSLDRERILKNLLSKLSIIQRFLIRRRLKFRKRKSVPLLPDKILGQRPKAVKTRSKRKPANTSIQKRETPSKHEKLQPQKARREPATVAERTTPDRAYDKGRLEDAVTELRRAMTRKNR
jgi:hypothetical protein